MDPGINFGIAILDTRGNVIAAVNKRNAKKSDVIKYVLAFGKPVIIASDVNPMPKTIAKIASALGSRTYYPQCSLTNLEKNKIIEDHEEFVKDIHQKDALAAGLKAFKNYHGLFLKVEEALKGKDGKIFEEVIKEILKHEDENIAEAIQKVQKRMR